MVRYINYHYRLCTRDVIRKYIIDKCCSRMSKYGWTADERNTCISYKQVYEVSSLIASVIIQYIYIIVTKNVANLILGLNISRTDPTCSLNILVSELGGLNVSHMITFIMFYTSLSQWNIVLSTQTVLSVS